MGDPRRSVLWHECAHGHQFGVVVESITPDMTLRCAACGTTTIKTFQRLPIAQSIPLPLLKERA